jgi:hypothetical protein
MNQSQISIELGVEQPSIKAANFIGFQIKREEWDLYKMEDGSLLKARLLLTSVLMEGKLDDLIKQIGQGQKPRLKISIASRNEYVIEPPHELRGEPDTKTYLPSELRAHILREDIDFVTVKASWNLYELENGIVLKMRLSPTRVDRTSKYEGGGMPVYLVDSSLEVKMELPPHIRALLEKKGST